MGRCTFSTSFPGLDGSGGAEQAVAALAEPYRRRGVQLEVVTFTGRDGLAAEVEAGRCDGAAAAAGRSCRRCRWRCAALVRSRRPDLVHTTLFDADLVGRIGGRLGGAPVVSSLVNVAYGPEQRANPALVAWKLEVARGRRPRHGPAGAALPRPVGPRGHGDGPPAGHPLPITSTWYPAAVTAARLGRPGPERRGAVRARTGGRRRHAAGAGRGPPRVPEGARRAGAGVAGDPRRPRPRPAC